MLFTGSIQIISLNSMNYQYESVHMYHLVYLFNHTVRFWYLPPVAHYSKTILLMNMQLLKAPAVSVILEYVDMTWKITLMLYTHWTSSVEKSFQYTVYFFNEPNYSNIFALYTVYSIVCCIILHYPLYVM